MMRYATSSGLTWPRFGSSFSRSREVPSTKKPHEQVSGEQFRSSQNGTSWTEATSGNCRRYTSFDRLSESAPSVRPWNAPSKVMPYFPPSDSS